MPDHDPGGGGIRRNLDGSLRAYGDRRAATDAQPTLDPWVEAALLTVFVVAFWLIASKVPANGDDWAWGSEIGILRLKRWFEGYNGRYSGNIIVLLMTRMGWFTPIVQAVGLAAMIRLILDITHNRTVLGYVGLSTLIFVMPAPLWRQTAVWVSGYANYITATLIMLIFIRAVLLELAECRTRPWRPAVGIGIFAFAVASQLVVEHMTIYLVAASILALLAGRIIRQVWSARLVCWMSGFVVGAVVMFSNSSYRAIAAGDSVKQVSKGGGSLVDNIPFTLQDRISTYGMTSNAAVVLAIAGLIVVAAILKRPTASNAVANGVVRAVAIVVGVATALMAVTKLSIQPDATGSNKTVAAAAIVLGLICLSSILLERVSDRLVLVIATGSWLLLNAPLLAIHPIPARTFFPSYALLLVIVSVLTSNFEKDADAQTLAVLTTVVALAGVMVWNNRMAIYNDIERASNERIAVAMRQVDDGATHLEIRPLPYPEWMARPDPYGETYATRFKAYYELPEDVSISAPR